MSALRSAPGDGGADDRPRRGGRPAWSAEHGGVALLALVAGMLVTALGLALVTAVVDVGVAAARARTAADAAALAAMASSPLYGGDGDVHAAAARAASANGARSVAAALDAWPFVVEVEVTVTPGTPMVRAALPEVRARAAAALLPGDPGD